MDCNDPEDHRVLYGLLHKFIVERVRPRFLDVENESTDTRERLRSIGARAQNIIYKIVDLNPSSRDTREVLKTKRQLIRELYGQAEALFAEF
jgi:DNA-directed RNA polymerase subunit F